jgi:small subunit ribosomal protein S26e
MTKKRRNNGRNKSNRGHVKRVHCIFSNKLVPKDKSIARYVVKNIIESSGIRDVQDACVLEFYSLPKLYYKNYYSVEAAIHNKIIRIRSKEGRKVRYNMFKKFTKNRY